MLSDINHNSQAEKKVADSDLTTGKSPQLSWVLFD